MNKIINKKISFLYNTKLFFKKYPTKMKKILYQNEKNKIISR